MKILTINVLGTDYIVKYGERKELDIADEQCGACCNYGEKVIKIVNDHFSDEGDEKANEVLIKETIIHELTHAFLYESGLVQYSNDEVLAEWFGVNFVKMSKTAFDLRQELGIV